MALPYYGVSLQAGIRELCWFRRGWRRLMEMRSNGSCLAVVRIMHVRIGMASMSMGHWSVEQHVVVSAIIVDRSRSFVVLLLLMLLRLQDGVDRGLVTFGGHLLGKMLGNLFVVTLLDQGLEHHVHFLIAKQKQLFQRWQRGAGWRWRLNHLQGLFFLFQHVLSTTKNVPRFDVTLPWVGIGVDGFLFGWWRLLRLQDLVLDLGRHVLAFLQRHMLGWFHRRCTSRSWNQRDGGCRGRRNNWWNGMLRQLGWLSHSHRLRRQRLVG